MANDKDASRWSEMAVMKMATVVVMMMMTSDGDGRYTVCVGKTLTAGAGVSQIRGCVGACVRSLCTKQNPRVDLREGGPKCGSARRRGVVDKKGRGEGSSNCSGKTLDRGFRLPVACCLVATAKTDNGTLYPNCRHDT